MNMCPKLVVHAVVAVLLLSAASVQAQLLIAGNDEKQGWNDEGKPVLMPPGKDTVSIIDVRNRAKPVIVANLPLMNSVVGPPTNVAITPDQHLALVANSLEWVQDGGGWKSQPDNKVYVIDLTVSPPALMATVTVGKQPSGIAINRAGTLALVAKFASHKVALLEIDGQKVTYGKYDMAVGLWPYNVQITSNGKLGIAGNSGNMGASDGQIDTAAIIDMEAKPPRVIDQVVVGDGPEGLAVSPAGDYVAVTILNGTGNVPKNAFFHTNHSSVSLLMVEGKKVRKVSQTDVGGLAEGV